MVIPPDACDPAEVAAVLGVADGAVPEVGDDELQPASRMAREAATAAAYGFIPVISDQLQVGFTSI
jgi:hypothetical protein